MGWLSGGFRYCTVFRQFTDLAVWEPEADWADAGLGGAVSAVGFAGGVVCPPFSPTVPTTSYS